MYARTVGKASRKTTQVVCDFLEVSFWKGHWMLAVVMVMTEVAQVSTSSVE